MSYNGLPPSVTERGATGLWNALWGLMCMKMCNQLTQAHDVIIVF